MPPLLNEDELSAHQDLSCDRFSSSSNLGDAAPCSRKKRTIKFDCDVVVQLIPNRDDYTSSEVNACWYTPTEKEDMYDSHAETVRRMEAGKRPKKDMTYRGLETWVKTSASQLDETVHACVDAVMDEQDRQWDELNSATIEWELFREVSLAVTRRSAVLAFEMAAYDECEAGKAYIAMANQELKKKRKQGRRQSLGAISVCTEDSEMTNTTMVRETKNQHKMKLVNTVRRLGRNQSDDIKKKKKKKSKKSSKKLKDASGLKKTALSNNLEPRTKLALAA